MRWIGRALLVLALLLGGAIVLAWTPDRDPAALEKRYARSPRDFLALPNRQRVHVRDEGPRGAPVIVLLHGSNSSLHTWDPWTQRLKRRFRIIRYDQPGHGLTGPHPRRAYDAAAFVDTLDQVTRALGIDRFVLAGNSMGGWVAWNYALAHPERLRGLALLDASGAPANGPTRLPIGFRLARSPLAPYIGKLTPRPLVARSVEQSMFVKHVVTPAMIDRYHDLLLYPGNRTATLDRATAPRPPATPAQMASIRVPTLLLWGAEDTLVPPAGARWFATHIPGSRLAVLPNVGHIPMEEAPDDSVRVLLDWMPR